MSGIERKFHIETPAFDYFYRKLITQAESVKLEDYFPDNPSISSANLELGEYFPAITPVKSISRQSAKKYIEQIAKHYMPTLCDYEVTIKDHAERLSEFVIKLHNKSKLETLLMKVARRVVPKIPSFELPEAERTGLIFLEAGQKSVSNPEELFYYMWNYNCWLIATDGQFYRIQRLIGLGPLENYTGHSTAKMLRDIYKRSNGIRLENMLPYSFLAMLYLRVMVAVLELVSDEDNFFDNMKRLDKALTKKPQAPNKFLAFHGTAALWDYLTDSPIGFD